MNQAYLDQYGYAVGVMQSINYPRSNAANANSIHGMLSFSWIGESPKDIVFSSTTYKYNRVQQDIFFALNYCDNLYQMDMEFEAGKTNGLSQKMQMLRKGLEQFKKIQRQIEQEEWEALTEFYEHNFTNHFAESRNDRLIKEDEFFIWFIWEVVKQIEAYLKRANPKGEGEYDTN